MKVFTLFAGYGGDKFALQKEGIDYKEVGFSEIDKFAVQCHEQNHKGKNFGDITKINEKELPDFDLLTGGFPCQSFSVAGKGLGVEDPRGQLFQHIIRIAEHKQPKYLLLENVKGLLSKKHKEFFEFTKEELKRIGYNIDVRVYNSKKYGIPQNRERVFYVCIRNDLEFNYVVPQEQELKIFLKDILEDEVEDKYYLKEEQIKNLLASSKKHTFGTRRIQNKEICNTLLSRDYKDPKIIVLGNYSPSNHNASRIVSGDGIAPTVKENHGTITGVLIKNATKKGFLEAKNGDGINLEQPNSKTRRGRVQQQMSPTLQCNDLRGVVTEELTIRKLTPKECFRLMGFLKDEINLDGLSNSQRYKLAGNGWEINLVSQIMKGFLK